jgi:hypothetical protein
MGYNILVFCSEAFKKINSNFKISYTVSGLRYFLFLLIPVLFFLIIYLYCRINWRKRSSFYYLASEILIVYVFVFFLFLCFGLRVMALCM